MLPLAPPSNAFNDGKNFYDLTSLPQCYRLSENERTVASSIGFEPVLLP